MDTKFQTSFIPKKPIMSDPNMAIRRSSGGTSIFMFVAIIIFVLSIGGIGFTFAWKKVLLDKQLAKQLELKQKEASFNETLIDQLKKANTKIDLGSQLLKKHLAVTELFDIVSQLTIQGVKFNSFEFSNAEVSKTSGGTAPNSTTGEGIKFSMKGVGNDFKSIAFQSDVLGESEKYGTKTMIKNPIISDLVVDEKGRVEFTFTGFVSTDDLLYSKTFKSTNSSQ
jgi:hypothetical protein